MQSSCILGYGRLDFAISQKLVLSFRICFQFCNSLGWTINLKTVVPGAGRVKIPHHLNYIWLGWYHFLISFSLHLFFSSFLSHIHPVFRARQDKPTLPAPFCFGTPCTYLALHQSIPVSILWNMFYITLMDVAVPVLKCMPSLFCSSFLGHPIYHLPYPYPISLFQSQHYIQYVLHNLTSFDGCGCPSLKLCRPCFVPHFLFTLYIIWSVLPYLSVCASLNIIYN